MIAAHPSTWSTRRWVTLVALLVAIIVLLLLAWPKPGPDHVTVRITNGPTVISTQVVPLH